MLKKLFCKHRYKYYHQSKYVQFLVGAVLRKWHFVCKDCGKTSVLYEEHVDNVYKNMSEKVAKEEAMGIDNSAYEDCKFTIGSSIYRGKVAYYMGRAYKKYNQEKEIPRYE